MPQQNIVEDGAQQGERDDKGDGTATAGHDTTTAGSGRTSGSKDSRRPVQCITREREWSRR